MHTLLNLLLAVTVLTGVVALPQPRVGAEQDAFQSGGPGADRVISHCTDEDSGDVISVGLVSSNVFGTGADFVGCCSASQGPDAAIWRTSRAGKLVWGQRIAGQSGREQVLASCQILDGRIYTAGLSDNDAIIVSGQSVQPYGGTDGMLATLRLDDGKLESLAFFGSAVDDHMDATLILDDALLVSGTSDDSTIANRAVELHKFSLGAKPSRIVSKQYCSNPVRYCATNMHGAAIVALPTPGHIAVLADSWDSTNAASDSSCALLLIDSGNLNLVDSVWCIDTGLTLQHQRALVFDPSHSVLINLRERVSNGITTFTLTTYAAKESELVQRFTWEITDGTETPCNGLAYVYDWFEERHHVVYTCGDGSNPATAATTLYQLDVDLRTSDKLKTFAKGTGMQVTHLSAHADVRALVATGASIGVVSSDASNGGVYSAGTSWPWNDAHDAVMLSIDLDPPSFFDTALFILLMVAAGCSCIGIIGWAVPGPGERQAVCFEDP